MESECDIMKKALYTSFGECAGDEEIVKAVLVWLVASDVCAQATDEDFPRYWRVCNMALDRLRDYFTNEAITSMIMNRDAIRKIISGNLNDVGEI